MKFKFFVQFFVQKFIARLLPLSSLEIGEYCNTALMPLLWRRILRILCRPFPKTFDLCLIYSILPEADGSVVDLGCGTGYTFGMLKAIDYRGKIKGYSIGIDIFPPYLKKQKPKQVYDDVVLCDIRHLPIHRAELALLIGVLEHLEKKEGIKLLDELKTICDNIVLTTTFGWHPLHPELDRNPYQRHRSAWLPSELKRLDFKVIVYEHPKWVSTLQRILQKTLILRHLITPLSSIIYIRKSPSNILLAFILAWRHQK
jgi:SAM-dependent methyltransferase